MKQRQAPPQSKFALLTKRFAALEAENRRLANECERLRSELDAARAPYGARSSLLEGVDAMTILSVNAGRSR